MRCATRCTRTATAPLILVLALTAAGCAARTHQVLTRFDATALAAVSSIGQVERSLSSVGQLTPQQSLSIRQKLRPVIDCGLRATAALQRWQPGQPVPTDLIDLSRWIGELLADVVKILPPSEAQAQLLAAIAVAQAAWMDILRIIVGGQT